MSLSSVTTIPWSCGFISYPSHHFRRNQRYYPSTRSKNPVYVTFNNQSSKNRRRYSFYCEFYFLAWRFFSREEKCQGVRMFICLEASPRLIKSGMTYGMTRVPTPTEFRICGRWRMLRRGITENNPFPSVQVHVGGVSAVLQLDRYTLLDFWCRLFHGSMGSSYRRSTIHFVSKILARFWRRVDVYCYTIVDSLAIVLAHYGIEDDLMQQLFHNVLNNSSDKYRYMHICGQFWPFLANRFLDYFNFNWVILFLFFFHPVFQGRIIYYHL